MMVTGEDGYYDLDDYDMDESYYLYVINAILIDTAFNIFAPILTNNGKKRRGIGYPFLLQLKRVLFLHRISGIRDLK